MRTSDVFLELYTATVEFSVISRSIPSGYVALLKFCRTIFKLPLRGPVFGVTVVAITALFVALIEYTDVPNVPLASMPIVACLRIPIVACLR